MCAKKKSASTKIWKLAGEPVYDSGLTAAELKQIKDNFLRFEALGEDTDVGYRCVTRSEARIHESATHAAAGFLWRYYAGKFERSAVIQTVSVSAASPWNLVEHTAGDLKFLTGAALWLLDYLEDTCGDSDKYLNFLPLEPDKESGNCMLCAKDLRHSQETVSRMVTVLIGRRKTHRKAFSGLLALIDNETAAELRAAFKISMLDYLDRAMEIYNRLKPVASKLPSEEEAFQPLDSLRAPNCISLEPEVVFLLSAYEQICTSASEIQKRIGSWKASELLAGYRTDDPYALCAAYLLLEKEGDAMANLNALTAIVIACAKAHLPWGEKNISAKVVPFQNGIPDYRLRYTYTEPPEKEGMPPGPGWTLSEAGLFFFTTGMIPPRSRVPSEELVEWYILRGVEEQRARELAWAAFMIYYINGKEYGRKDDELAGGKNTEEQPPLAERENFCEMPKESSRDGAVEAQNEELSRKIKELRSALHDAEQASKRLQEQLRDSERRGEADRSELAQLRETLYELRSEEDGSDESGSSPVELPWEVNRRVVAFGGHDSWRKAVKPLLPGVRFYDREIIPDLNVIRGADVVWLQVNALSHGYYYRIIDAAQKNGTPVRYFGSASAKKCAVQLVLDELAAAKRDGPS